jgi:DNA polymerase I-like protein with 3'-5' exonuclease and polymerase domains
MLNIPVQPPVEEIRWVRSVSQLPEVYWFDQFPVIAVDIETNTLDRNALDARVLQVGIGVSKVASGDPRTCGVVTYILTESVLNTLPGRVFLHELYTKNRDKIGGHNYKFDILFQRQHLGVPMYVAWDTMLMANVIHEAWFKSLKDLATFYHDADDYELALKNYLKQTYRKKVDQHYGNVPESMLGEYLKLDLTYTLQLYYDLREELEELGRWEHPYTSYEIPLNNTLCVVEWGGFRVDETKRTWASDMMGAEVDRLAKVVIDLSNGQIENPNSPVQIAKYLWDVLKLPFPRMSGYSYPTTANPVLEETRDLHPIVPAVIKYRRVTKLKSSYIDNLDKFLHNGYVFPGYKQAHVKTGRLSAADPAIQTIPRKDKRKDGDGNYGQIIKTLYVPDPGHTLVAVDGSQWELRVAAGWSQDTYLLKVYNDGIDFHGAMCDLLYGTGWNSAMRADEKRIMFGLLYGGSLESLVSVANLTIEQKTRVMNVFNTELTGLIKWRDIMFKQAQTGSIVSPYFNRAFHFDLITKGNKRDVEKWAVNWPVQGTASMITCEAATQALPRLAPTGARIVATIHDSIIASTPVEYKQQVAKIVSEELEAAGSRAFSSLPWVAEAEVGDSWGAMEAFDYADA